MIAVVWSQFQDLALPIQEGTITGIAIEWEDCVEAIAVGTQNDSQACVVGLCLDRHAYKAGPPS